MRAWPSSCRCGTARSRSLLWQRAREPFQGTWALPGGLLDPGETLEASIRRHLAAKVDVRELSHLEQLATYSDPAANRRRGSSRPRTSAGPARRRPRTSPGTRAGMPSTTCRRWRSTTGRSCSPAASACAAKLSYSNAGFALAPRDVHARRAARGLRRRARPRRLGDEPSARARAPRRDRADRRAAPGSRRGTPGRGLPLPLPAPRDHRSVRRAPPAAVRSAGSTGSPSVGPSAGEPVDRSAQS